MYNDNIFSLSSCIQLYPKDQKCEGELGMSRKIKKMNLKEIKEVYLWNMDNLLLVFDFSIIYYNI